MAPRATMTIGPPGKFVQRVSDLTIRMPPIQRARSEQLVSALHQSDLRQGSAFQCRDFDAVFSGLAPHPAVSFVMASAFCYLQIPTCLAAGLPISLASLSVPKAFVTTGGQIHVY
jgi:hypothetical protein